MILRDPVHGLVAFESPESQIVVQLLKARELQRLRRIRQLGLTSLAYPGAEHTRFAHALGAAHVMQLFIARMRQVETDLPPAERLQPNDQVAALAAALLHDLGHGPLSHLYEAALPNASHHEQWTEAIVLDPSTDVNRILCAHSAELPAQVAGLIHGRHRLPYLSRAVSGTFDVDRCDYLLRDAHSTGVRYGEFDLPWLLRSLRIDPQPAASAHGHELVIDGLKGLSAIESFILARLFMFQQVYYHKATRAAEFMIGCILGRAIELVRDGVALDPMPRAVRLSARGEPVALVDHLEMDDVLLLHAIRGWESAKDPVLAQLARALSCRQLFKTIDLDAELDPHAPGFAGLIPQHRHARALEIAEGICKKAGLDPRYHVGLDSAATVPYSDDASLSVLLPNGRRRSPREVSLLLDRLCDQRVTRPRLLFSRELRVPIQLALGIDGKVAEKDEPLSLEGL